MKWLRDYFARRSRARAITDAARYYAERFFPSEEVLWSVISIDGADSCIVCVTHKAEFIPPPRRFFRVTFLDLSVSPMPADYRPPGSPPYR
jgi:hypothetical protein